MSISKEDLLSKIDSIFEEEREALLKYNGYDRYSCMDELDLNYDVKYILIELVKSYYKEEEENT